MALGRLTAGIAHEVKNPLNAMMIHLELLRTKIRRLAQRGHAEPQVMAAAGVAPWDSPRPPPALPAPAQGALQHVEVIEGEIRRLDEVVQGFLRFTRPEDLKLQPVRVACADERASSRSSRPRPARTTMRLLFDCPASAPAVNGDSGDVAPGVPEPGHQRLPGHAERRRLRLTCAATSKQRVEVRVEDTGVGIAPEHLSKIFDLYFTTKDAGTGIGLSMVYRIVQLHDGEIEVQSTPGRGTIFRVLLPRAID